MDASEPRREGSDGDEDWCSDPGKVHPPCVNVFPDRRLSTIRRTGPTAQRGGIRFRWLMPVRYDQAIRPNRLHLARSVRPDTWRRPIRYARSTVELHSGIVRVQFRRAAEGGCIWRGDESWVRPENRTTDGQHKMKKTSGGPASGRPPAKSPAQKFRLQNRRSERPLLPGKAYLQCRCRWRLSGFRALPVWRPQSGSSRPVRPIPSLPGRCPRWSACRF